jgi:hypothetical protein
MLAMARDVDGDLAQRPMDVIVAHLRRGRWGQRAREGRRRQVKAGEGR